MRLSDLIDDVRDMFSRAEDRVQEAITDITDRIRYEVKVELGRIKKWVFVSVFQIVLYALGIILAIGAITVFAARFLPIDLVLLIEAAILIYVAVMLHLIRP